MSWTWTRDEEVGMLRGGAGCAQGWGCVMVRNF